MISSIKNQQPNIQSTTADKHQHHTAVEDMLIMPLNDDDDDNNSNNIFTIPKIVATSIQSSSFNKNYIDSQLFNDNIGNNNNNNNNNSDFFHTTINSTHTTNLLNPTGINTAAITTTPITEIINSNPINTNGLITDNNLLNSNNINYKNISNNKEILCQNNFNKLTTAITTAATTTTNSATKILSQSNINDTQNLLKNYNNINDNKLLKNKQSIIIKPTNMSIIKPLIDATSAISTITTINNNSLKVSLPNDNQNDLNNEILFNLNSTIPINNTKDFIYKNKNTNDNIIEQQIQHQQSKQQIINKNNNLINVISNNNNNNNTELKQFNSTNSISYLNQNIKNENDLILNKNNTTINNIDNKSALLLNSSSNNNNSSNNPLNFYSNATETITTMPVETSELELIENNNNSASSLSYNNTSPINNISQLQKSSQQQTYEPLKLLTTTSLQNLTSRNSKFLNNIKISTYNKLPGFNKTDGNNATIIKTITSNSNLINSKNNNNNNNAESPIKTSATTANGLKRVGFINLEQNGWNLNFITTTSLIPPITAASALSTQQSTTTAATTTTASQIPIKATTTINNCNNNIRINSLSNNVTENIKSTVNNIVNNNNNSFKNSTIVNRSLIEDVHNYSKKSKRFPGECISTTNSSVEEDESDEDDDDDEDVEDDYEADDGGEDEQNVRQNDTKFDYRKFLTTRTKNNNNTKKKRFQMMESEDEIKNDENTVKDGIKKLNDKIKNIIGVEQRNISERHHSEDDENNYKTSKTQQKETNLGANGKNGEENGDVPSLRPEHHARRPMNAFLIFCKRHRAIVRDKYKNVENRQVTKILGEWWENMSQEEKSCYTNLAKEYKDAFLSANPNFKWYKLPAPPLRTLCMRPTNSNESLITEEQLPNMSSSPSKQNQSLPEESVQTIVHSMNVHTKSPTVLSKFESGNMGVFKFADEAQMGGLSSLLNGNSSPTSGGNNSPDLINFRKVKVEPNVDHEDLQSALSETSQYISLAILKTEPASPPLEKMYNHAKKMSMTLKNNKRKNTEQDVSVGCKKFIRDNSFSSGEEDNWLRKPTRSCKGKKYQELISSGQIATSSKKIKKSNLNLNFAQSNFMKFNTNKESSSDSDGAIVTRTESNNCNSSSSPLKYELKDTKIDNLLTTTKNNNDIKGSEQCDDHQMAGHPDDSSGKPFDTNAFDLETKIMALPAQDLEEYLQKKQESKCKKKIATKRRKNFSIKKSKSNNSTNASSTSSQLPLSEKSSQKILNNQQKDNVQQNKQQKKQYQHDSLKEQVVGSQKRKARKESITRRDLSVIYKTTAAVINDSNNSSMNWVDLNVDLKTIENKIESNLIKSEKVDSDGKVSDNTICEQPIIQQPNHHQPINHDSNNPLYNISQPQVTSNTDLLILAEVASNFDE